MRRVIVRDVLYVPEAGQIPPGEHELEESLAELLLERGLAYLPEQAEAEAKTGKTEEAPKKRR